MITRRGLLGAAVGIAGAAAVAGCGRGSASSSPSGPAGGSKVPLRADGYPDLTWKGTISTGVQGYTPAVEGVKLAPGTAKLAEFGKAADEFTKLYPDIKISFLGSEYTYDVDQMKTAATGGQLPDVWWQQAIEVKNSFPKGSVANLAPAMEQPNPFIKGNARWRDVYNQTFYNQTAVNESTTYTNNGDYVGTAFFYNKQMFSDAGVTTTPKTWDELLALCDNLKAKGMTPVAYHPYNNGFGWLARIFLTNLLGLDTLKKIDAFSEAPGISTQDTAVAWKQGLIDPRKNPGVLAWWPVAKQLLDYADRTILQLPPKAPTGSPDQGTYFAAKKVPMIYDGTWAPGTVKDNGADFEVGSFAWPSLTGSYQYATDYDSSAAVGGPNAAWQFQMSTERSDSSLREQGKTDAVLAWMQFFSTPERNQAICNERGAFLPTFSGTTPPDSLKDLQALTTQPLYAVSGGADFSTEATDQVGRLFQQYALGQVGMDEVSTKYPAIIDKGFNAYVRSNPIDFDKYPA